MTSPWPPPDPNPLPTGPRVDDPTGLRFDRADLDEPAPTVALREAGGWAVTGRDPCVVADLGCGHLPGEPHDGSCDYWRGVLTGEYERPETYAAQVISLPPFDLRELAAQGITAAEQDRRERAGAA